MDENWVHGILRWLQAEEAPPLGNGVIAAIERATIEELEQFIESVSAVASEFPRAALKSRVPLQHVAGQLKNLRNEGGVDLNLCRIHPDVLASAYEVLASDQPMAAAHLIQMLAIQCDDDSLVALAGCVEAIPPASAACAPAPRAFCAQLCAHLRSADRLDCGARRPGGADLRRGRQA